MAGKDSDYFVVIATMHCPHHTILVLKLTLVVEIASAFKVPLAAIARSLSAMLVASTVIRRAHKDSDHTAVIAVVH